MEDKMNYNVSENFHRELEKTIESAKHFQWENKDFYASWLAQTYYFVQSSTRLIALTAAYMPLDRQDAHFRFIDHAKEERNHEILLERDIKSLDRKFSEIPEYSCTSAFYQSQYYWIQHRNPFSFFGYILILEGVAAYYGEEACNRVLKAHGKNSASFLKVHAKEDQSHLKNAIDALKDLPQNAQKDLCENIIFCGEHYRSILKQCAINNEFLSTKKAG